MRGKAPFGEHLPRETGITPAYAGKRCSDRWLQTVPGDHPRICGEKRLQSTLRGTQNGSPPHMRGKVAVGGTMKNLNGITPAYAGKRSPTGRGRFQPWDHPRICGEKPSPPARLHCFRGSPPHMRGKAFLCAGVIAGLRITPAYAGKSNTESRDCLRERDHPRICGEKSLACAERRQRPGITPAYAGKSWKLCFLGSIIWDHPRICGEKMCQI